MILTASTGFSCEMPAYQLDFKVYHDHSVVGKTTEYLKISKGGSYQFGYHFAMDLLFYKDKSFEQSTGHYTPSLILPDAYHFSDSHSGEKTSVVFNRKTKKILINNSLNGQSKLILNPKLYDHIGYQLTLRQAIIHHQFPKKMRVLNLHGQPETLTITWQPTTIKTPLGEFKTMEAIAKTKTKGKVLESKFWFAKKYDYVMIQNDTVVNGDTIAHSVPIKYNANIKWGCI